MTLSLRHKILALVAATLLAAIGTFLWIATELFTKDKLAYVYDLQAALVETLSEQTRSQLDILSARVGAFATQASPSSANDLFVHEPDLLRVRIFVREMPGGPLVETKSFTNAPALDRLGIEEEDLAAAEREHPLALEAVAATSHGVQLVNSSIPPDAPVLTLITEKSGRVVATDFDSQRLLRFFGRSNVHHTYLVNHAGEVVAHPDASRVIGRADLSRHALVQKALRSTTQRSVQEFESEGASHLGAWAKVGTGGLTVITDLPKADAVGAARELVRRSALIALAILLAAFVASVYFSRQLVSPLTRLSAAAESIGKGKFDIQVDRDRHDEIGDLARAFLDMARELEKAQEQLVTSARMAAFGQMSAGITHEVKNPITGIVSLAQIARTHLDDPDRVKELLRLIENEGLRCREILSNLLHFARKDGTDRVETDVNTLVRDSLRVAEHQLLIHAVALETEYADALPRVVMNASQIKQVIVNLALNAQQAMPEGGRVRVRTAAEDGNVVISVEDNGPGIPEEVRKKIFEPFFTTKGSEGSGLGLSVSQSIIAEHGGSLSVDTQVGRGTRFDIRLPAAAASRLAHG